ncbi:MAG: PD-(D/E)XK nuclease family transposase, partial [Sphingobacterium sp.]
MKQSKYIDLTTDFGFKRIFGTEVNSEFLISLLNGLFRGRKEIKEIVYNKNEHVGDSEGLGTVIFDLTCTGSDGERFVIEVQRTSQNNLKRRMLYYGSKMISDQAPKGNRRGWDYDISEVYVVVLMDGFPMPDHTQSEQFLHDICLCDRDSCSVFYENLGFIYVELLNFNKMESELENDLD